MAAGEPSGRGSAMARVSSAKAAMCNGMKRQLPESLCANFNPVAVRLRKNVGGKHKLLT